MIQKITNYGIDHYTLIVPNAKEISDFHENVLGYKFLKNILVNAGSAPKGQHDMLNYVLSWPYSKQGVMVVTEGLTKESIFHKFMTKFGQGIHHIAFEIENIQKVFENLKENNIELTSDQLLRDPLNGLKQFFISNKYLGIFIELIERKAEDDNKSETEEQGFFTQDNMSGLAKTMNSYLESSVKEDANIKDLDQTNYHSSSNEIKINQIKALELFPDDITIASQFLKDVFGFIENKNGLYNPSEPEVNFILNKTNNLKEGVIPAKLILNTTNPTNGSKVLDNLGLDFSKNNNDIDLDITYSGYPLTISS